MLTDSRLYHDRAKFGPPPRVSVYLPEKRNAGPNGWRWEGLTQNDVTLPSILKQAGYQTIFAGKAHFAPIGHEGEDPTKLGFDINIAGCSFGRPGSYYGEDGYGKLNPKQKKASRARAGKIPQDRHLLVRSDHA